MKISMRGPWSSGSLLAAVGAVGLLVAAAGSAAAEDLERAHLLEVRNAVLKEGKVALEKAIKTAEKSGKPVAASYDLKDGKLRLSVWVATPGGPAEVVIDHKSGKVVGTPAPLTGADAAAAKAAETALATAKLSLADAVLKEKPDKKSKGISVTVATADGRPKGTLVYAVPGPTSGAWSMSVGYFLD
jgi:hypothetical protein